MRVTVSFYSWFKDLAGCACLKRELPENATLGELVAGLKVDFPKLAALQRSMLMAVDVDYQPPSYVLKDGDEVSLFPPVQGG